MQNFKQRSILFSSSSISLGRVQTDIRLWDAEERKLRGDNKVTRVIPSSVLISYDVLMYGAVKLSERRLYRCQVSFCWENAPLC